MQSPLAVLKEDWRSFKDDPPGERFGRLRERARERSPALAIVLAVLGVILLLGGVVLLFVPGPGILAMVFGLALVATASERVARWMDRAEPWVRRRWAKLRA